MTLTEYGYQTGFNAEYFSVIDNNTFVVRKFGDDVDVVDVQCDAKYRLFFLGLYSSGCPIHVHTNNGVRVFGGQSGTYGEFKDLWDILAGGIN